jgi:hypothetical protein
MRTIAAAAPSRSPTTAPRPSRNAGTGATGATGGSARSVRVSRTGRSPETGVSSASITSVSSLATALAIAAVSAGSLPETMTSSCEVSAGLVAVMRLRRAVAEVSRPRVSMTGPRTAWLFAIAG